MGVSTTNKVTTAGGWSTCRFCGGAYRVRITPPPSTTRRQAVTARAPRARVADRALRRRRVRGIRCSVRIAAVAACEADAERCCGLYAPLAVVRQLRLRGLRSAMRSLHDTQESLDRTEKVRDSTPNSKSERHSVREKNGPDGDARSPSRLTTRVLIRDADILSTTHDTLSSLTHPTPGRPLEAAHALSLRKRYY